MPKETHTGRPPQSRRTKILLGIAGVIVAIPVAAVIFLLTYNWDHARPWLDAKVSEAIGRPFTIAGHLAVQWERPSSSGVRQTWRDYIPWPHLIANDVHVGNPVGMPAGDMASVRRFSFSLNPFALLSRTIAIPVLRFESPSVQLLRLDPEHNNWTFPPQHQTSRWTIDLDRIVLTQGVIHVVDAVTRADLTADVDTLENDPTYGIGWKLRGTYHGARVDGSGKAGAVLSLKRQDTPYPILADLRSGANRIAVEGTVTRPAQLAALDLKLKLAGQSMARLYNFTGVLLPETPAFTTEGHLIGSMGPDGSHWTYDNFKGKVGASDIGGRLEYRTGKPRGKLSGNVVSHQLRFADLGPMIGADSNASKTARGVAAVQPAGKVLPVEQFHTEKWKSLDADVRFATERIVREKTLPINKLSTHLTLKDGVLTLDPLDFGMAGGTLSSHIRLDGSGSGGKDAIKATTKMAARRIQIRQLFPAVEKLQASVGELNGDVSLSGVGNSVATLLATSNGELKTLIDQGTVSKLLLEEMGLNLGNIIVAKLFGDKQVPLNCMATDFIVTNGLMQTKVFVIDTSDARITVDGTISLATEQMDLTIHPETSLRLLSLRTPLYVRGSFGKPEVSVNKGVLALKAGGAALLAAAAAPAAALLPLIHTGPGESSNCGRLLAEMRQKPVAPPGKTRTR
ncbi:AsmA family protein [Massilia horti]|uniref:AsmA family protein n=1 Tax=Massilia horti TaxID=2562153 RepID=A0A4Y9TB45_9BURK|nr:AsmA family protein [Massilia horti]TFW36053.1 AsmA family protein [Massilia horti]